MRGVLIRSSAKIRARAAARAETPSSPGLEMASLVDVAFLLLTFFILTSTLDPREGDLGLLMAPPPGPETAPKKVVIPEPTRIRIAADGVVWCNDEIVEPDAANHRLSGLLEQLRTIKAANIAMAYGNRAGVSPLVEVSAADEVSGQRFIDVMNCLAEAGIDSVVLEGFLE